MSNEYKDYTKERYDDFVGTVRALLENASEEEMWNIINTLADSVLQSELLTTGCITHQVTDYLEKDHIYKVLENENENENKNTLQNLLRNKNN